MEAKSVNEKYCHECGEVIRLKAEICPKCGVRQPSVPGMYPGGDSNLLGQGKPRVKNTAGVLALLLGGAGIHKFYMGKPLWGVAYIVFIWTFIPAIFGLIEGLNFLTMSEEVFQRRHSGPAWKSN